MDLKLENFFPYRLSRLSEAFSEEIRPVYKQTYGLNRPEWRVLAAMADIAPCSATDLCTHSAQHKTKVSRAVRSLELRRWIRRQTDEKDRRSEVLHLTEAGLTAYRALATPLKQREEKVLERLSQAERKQVETALILLEKAVGLTPPKA